MMGLVEYLIKRAMWWKYRSVSMRTDDGEQFWVGVVTYNEWEKIKEEIRMGYERN